MYIEVVLWIEGNNNGSVVVNTTTQSVSCLLGGNDMTKFNENLTVSVAYNYSTRKHISLYFNYFVSVRSWYFDANNITESFTFRYYVLFYSFYFLRIKKIFNREHIQKLNNSTCRCAMLSNRKLLVIWNCLMHLDVDIFLKAFAGSLHFQSFVFYF